VQDACNLSGVVYGWARTMAYLRACLETDPRVIIPTEDFNQHPINVMWAEKCRTLAFGQEDFCPLSHEKFDAAYAECKKLAELS
jgi:hypothetical protein